MPDALALHAPTRRALGAGLSALVLSGLQNPDQAWAAGATRRDPAAEQFIAAQAQRIVGLLADRRQREADRERAFNRIIDEVVDVPRVTTFVLGRYGRLATAEQRQDFAIAFRGYAQRVYLHRLEDFRGDAVKVLGSVVRQPGDVVVETSISGGQLTQPLPVGWRVLATSGAWKIVDVRLKGVWLAITQQQDFVSTIDNAGGDVGVLTAQLKQDALHSGTVR